MKTVTDLKRSAEQAEIERQRILTERASMTGLASTLHDVCVDAHKNGLSFAECVGALALVQSNWGASYTVAFLESNFPTKSGAVLNHKKNHKKS